VKTVSVGALLFWALGSALSQTHPEPYTLLEQYIRLKDDQIANLEHGKAVAQILPSAEPLEVVVFGAIRIHASPEDYLRLAQHLDSFRALPNYLGVRQFTRRRNCQVEKDLSSKTTTSRISKASTSPPINISL
jgi:hypothetical protein